MRANYLVVRDGYGGYDLSDIDSTDGDSGSFAVNNFERLRFEDQFVDLPVYIPGNQTLVGTLSNDVLIGTVFDDLLIGLGGNDVLRGGAGIDTASYADSGRGVQVNLALAGIQNTGDGRDTLISIENLIGSNFNDGLRGDGSANTLDGGRGNDNLFGFGGEDVLIGGYGNDSLLGGDGNDVLTGGAGRDALAGGGGTDQFVFDNINANPSPDTVRDFTHGTDQIAFDKMVFTAFGASIDATEFFIGTKALTADHHLIYNAASGALFYDADGAGGAAQIQVAQLSTRPMVDVSDFMLI